MTFKIFFALSLLIIVCGLLSIVFIKNNGEKIHKKINYFYIFFLVVFLADVSIFIPIYDIIFTGDMLKAVKVLLLSVHNTIRLFIVDGEFNIILDYLPENEFISTAYSMLSAVLFVVSPLLTFGAVVTLIANAYSYFRYILGYNRNMYVFSELNEKSLCFAVNLYNKSNKNLIIFTDVYESNDETNFELRQRAKQVNAILFKNDVTQINFKIHSPKKAITILLIGDDDSENVEQSLILSESLKNREKTDIYVFSTSAESELVLSAIDSKCVNVRRIDETRSLIFRFLYDRGERIFDNAVDKGDYKLITAVVVGLGGYSTELTRALTWFCQMIGYRVKIIAVDKELNCEKIFRANYPDLYNEKYNGNLNDLEESQYKLKIIPGIDVNTDDFYKLLEKIENPTFVFVSLGDDNKNVKTSNNIRMMLEKRGLHPDIVAISHNSKKINKIEKAINFKDQPYDLKLIGGMNELYSEDVLLQSDIEQEALRRHLCWGDEKSFWNYEYNYRSSVASAIHKKMKHYCKVPGIEKKSNERTKEETIQLRMLEHRRWNAYMRSEGYTYSPVRNDLAKQHNLLVRFSELSEEDQIKDDD